MKNASIGDGELELINQYTRRPLTAEQVFVFTVALCDNEIDRDYERFTVESLEALSGLFVGKTGIFDHNPSAKNQTARIISCRVENVPGKLNSLGDDYFRLTARAYMPVSEGNRELREAIDSGIIREVSVGCSVGSTVCSICGEELARCHHIKGEYYNGKLCYGELINPTDAYEFSFVAVPAQKGAGIIKSCGKERKMTDIIKSIENGEAVTLGKGDCLKLRNYIEGLKKQAADGAYYRTVLEGEVLKFSALAQPEVSRKTMESVVGALSLEELRELKAAYKSGAAKKLPPEPQLFAEKTAVRTDKNTEFKI